MKPFAVCKQDVSENLVIPQSLSLPKQSQNLAFSKNILTDAKGLDVPLLSERCASSLGTQCNFSWTKGHALIRAELRANLHTSYCLHCYIEVCFCAYLFLISLGFFSRVIFLSPSCPATCSSLLWYLIFMDCVCILKSYPKNGLHVAMEMLTFCKWISFWQIW